MDWKEYQEAAAEFFRSLGLEAQTDAPVQGVRTSHNVDVLVRSHHVGFDVMWIVECKHWNTKVPIAQEKAKRTNKTEAGADRGIILSESGFQRGAFAAAALTNVQLTSLAELRMKSEREINAVRLGDLLDRIIVCKRRYWNIPKGIRIKYGLRPEESALGYSGDVVVKAVEDILSQGLCGRLPVQSDSIQCIALGLPEVIATSSELIAITSALVVELENRLDRVPQHSQM